MEIKELVPKSKEIIIRTPEREGVFFDTFSYIIQNQIKNDTLSKTNGNGKSYLYIISQIYANNPSLDYVPNLIASFIKRELESGNGHQDDDDRLFENSLKKVNELIEELFKNNSGVKLDLGVAFINKEKMALSKIGKAKMLAYRPQKNDIFDVFENVTQFSKMHINNKRFLNIISGEIKKGDKFFFFTPNTKLNFKQKQIASTLCKSGQNNFPDSIHKIISPEKNKKAGEKEPTPVPCCGIYFEINEETKKINEELVKKTTPPLSTDKEPQITATEVSKINKDDTLKRTMGKFKEMVFGGNVKTSTIKASNYLVAAVIAVTVIAGLILITRGNSEFKKELAAINEKLKISESRILLKQNYEARKSLNEALEGLNLLEENKDKNEILMAAISLVNRIEKVDTSKKPEVFIDLTKYQNSDLRKLKNVLAIGTKIFTNDSEKLYAVGENELSTIDDSGNIMLSWLKENKIVVYGTGIKIIDLEKNKVSELKKKFSFEPVEIKNYEDNLYFLGPKNIYKITNALLKPTEEFEWLKTAEAEKIPGNFVSFDLDSNVYVLTNERRLAILFKGNLEKLTDLEFDIGTGTELINLGNNELLVIDKEKRLARVIDNLGGIKLSYILSDIDIIKDIFFEKEARTLYVLSPTKIWSLKL